MNKRMASLSKGAVPEISWRRIRLYRLVSYRSVPAFPSTGSDPHIGRLLAPSHRVTRQCRLGLPSALGSGSPLTEMDSNFWFLVAKGQTVIRDGTAVSKTGADLLGNRRFESISLRRRVRREPEFVAPGPPNAKLLRVGAITDDLDFLKAQPARVPTRKELARIA